MTMKTFLFTFQLVLLALSMHAQSSSIEGQVEDAGHLSLEFVNVVLCSAADSSIARVAVTDFDGHYEFIQIPAGTYFIRTSFIGYLEYAGSHFSLTDDEHKIHDKIALQSSSQVLDEMTIVYRKPPVKVEADKLTFNVEGTINSTGLSAIELLRKIPGVMLDNNDNISIKGRSGIIVYIDGKRTALEGDALKAYLRTMQSGNIESIEVITNPSAKYDAAGTAGIINIKLKKNKNFGTNGSLMVGYNVQIYSKYNTGFSINHRNDKWNLFANYGFNAGKSWGWMDLYRRQLNPYDSITYTYDQVTDMFNDNSTHNYKLGFDRNLGKKHSIGAMVSGNISDESSEGKSFTRISAFGENVLTTLEAYTLNTSDRNNINGNINYHFADSSGHEFNFDTDYGIFSIHSNTYQPNRYAFPGDQQAGYDVDYRFTTPVEISILSAKGDYEQNLAGGKLAAGFKSSLVKTENTLERFNIIQSRQYLDSLLSNRFSYREEIHAAYVNYKKQFRKFSFQSGIRAEQTRSKGELTSFTTLSNENSRNVSRSYLNFFPSGGLTFSPSDTNQFSLTFSRRIDRPSYQDLNPFEFKLDELSYQRGNPFLQPQYGNVFELTHTYKYSLNTSLTYSYTSDFFSPVTDTAAGNASYIMTKNLGYEEWIGLNISSPVPIGKRVNGFFNLNAGRKHIHADFNDINVIVWSYSAFGQVTLNLPSEYSLELSGWFSGPGVWGATFVTKPMGSMDAAMKKELVQGRLILRLALSDIFYTNKWRSTSRIPQLEVNAKGGWESRQFRVNLTWNFGNQQAQIKQRKSGADDLRNRIK